jgi:hypothetical protein
MLTSIALGAAAVYGLFMGLITNATGGPWASVVFKVIPFAIGAVCAFALLKNLGYIIVT